MAQTQAFVEISQMELGSLLSRVESAHQDGSKVAPDDLNMLVQMAKTFAYLHQKLEKTNITNLRLRKLLGITPKSEKSGRSAVDAEAESQAEEIALQSLECSDPKEIENLLAEPSSDENRSAENSGNGKPDNNKGRSKHGKRNAGAFKEAELQMHPLIDFSSGCVCGECARGKLYKFEPATFVRIKGQVPLEGTVHILEQMRCNHCQKVYKAALPQDLIDDGATKQRFGYSAVAIVALLKYAAAFPWHRLSDLQAMLGTPISPSTLWDLMERLANCLKPLHNHLQFAAANANFFKIDDTGNRIINIDPKLKKKRNSEKEQLRTGIHTSGLIATTLDGHDIVLFKTGIQHAGEFFDEILDMRPNDAGTFVYMSDALSSNNPTKRQGEKSLCNAHCRRQFDEIKEKYPEEAQHVLETYRLVYKLDAECRKDLVTPAERLLKHIKYSLPLMENLIVWAKALLDNRKVEPNSSLGEAFGYLIKHQKGLLAFTRIEGAALDNNLMENKLRIIVLSRKNSLHFKEQIGAAVADIITSICSTAEATGSNCFDYLINLQRHAEKVKASPDKFLPWNYQQTVNDLIKIESPPHD